jgi:hypothetical protein
MTAPELLKQQMPMVREIEANLDRLGYQRGTEEWRQMFDYDIAFYRKFVGEVKKWDIFLT